MNQAQLHARYNFRSQATRWAPQANHLHSLPYSLPNHPKQPLHLPEDSSSDIKKDFCLDECLMRHSHLSKHHLTRTSHSQQPFDRGNTTWPTNYSHPTTESTKTVYLESAHDTHLRHFPPAQDHSHSQRHQHHTIAIDLFTFTALSLYAPTYKSFACGGWGRDNTSRQQNQHTQHKPVGRPLPLNYTFTYNCTFGPREPQLKNLPRTRLPNSLSPWHYNQHSHEPKNLTRAHDHPDANSVLYLLLHTK